MNFCRNWTCTTPLWALVLGLTFSEASFGQEPQWVAISDAVVAKVADGGKKAASFEKETAGVAVDPMSGDVYMIVNKQGVWKSTDGGKTFARSDGGKVSGRCETAYALNADPAGNRLACFMLDGKCAWTGDGGKTWQAMADVGRNWDFAAVDWYSRSTRNTASIDETSPSQSVFFVFGFDNADFAFDGIQGRRHFGERDGATHALSLRRADSNEMEGPLM